MAKILEFKNRFEVSNKTETSGEILLYSAIGESFFGESISAKDFKKKLSELPKSVKQVDLRINSPGGSVFDGMAIYELIKSHPAKFTAYIDGISASIASVIMLAADEIVIGEGALVMIHKPMSGIYGNSTEMLRVVEILDKIEGQMVNIYAKRTKLTRSEITSAVSKETWFTADEALEAGLADKTMAADASLQIAACLEGCPWIKNAPKIKSVDNIARAKLNGVLANAQAYMDSKNLKKA